MYPLDLDSTLYYGLVTDPDTNRVLGSEPWFIKFFAPWCGHCQRLAPTWEELHIKMFFDLNVASVDCTSDHGAELCKAFQIRSYPTLLYLPHGDTKYYQYKGPRGLEDL